MPASKRHPPAHNHRIHALASPEKLAAPAALPSVRLRRSLRHPASAVRVPSPVVHLNYATPRCGIPSPQSFRRWTEAALSAAGHHKVAELSIRIVGTREGRTLNRQYRGKDSATNVLSFPVELPRGVASALLGDVVICAPVVAREAREQGKRPRDHYAHLTVHGVLHLLGYDHQNESDASRMEAFEKRILAGLGIEDPFRSDRGPTV